MTSLWDRARERFFQTDLKIWSGRAASGAGENIGSTAWNMEEDDPYEYASNCGVVWTPASTTPSEIAFIPTVTLGSVEDALFTRGAALAMDWDPEGTPLSASYNTKRVGVTGIQSVTWKERTAELSDDPHQSDESVRVYPEKDLDGTLKNKLKVQVELVKEVPDGMEGTVFLKILDPHNQCTGGSSNGMESVIPISDWLLDESDNFGYANFVLSSLLFEGHNIETLETDKIQNATFEINSAHAGDNYIVVAMPNSESCDAVSIQTVPDAEGICDYKTPGFDGGNGSVPVSENHKTSLLTVWRTLWLEVDQLQYEDEVAEEPSWNGINMENIYSELQKACITVNIVPVTANSNKIINTNLRAIEHTSFYYDVNNKRDIANTESFWSIQMVMAFSRIDSTVNSAIMGTAYNNMIYIFNDTIEENMDVYKDVVILHEIVHALGYGHDEQENVLMSPDVSFDLNDPRANDDLLARYIRCIQSQNKPVLVL